MFLLPPLFYGLDDGDGVFNEDDSVFPVEIFLRDETGIASSDSPCVSPPSVSLQKYSAPSYRIFLLYKSML